MSRLQRVQSTNVDELEARPVLVPAGNKARLVVGEVKPSSKPARKFEKPEGVIESKKIASPVKLGSGLPPAVSPSSGGAHSVLRRHELLIRSNLSLNASCSSDASTDSFCSRASTGRIGRPNMVRRAKPTVSKVNKAAVRLDKVVPDGVAMSLPPELYEGKRRCAWVTANADPCYRTFHDEEWGAPVHDDKKLFELLVLSGALAELTWPAILSKRQIFREIFMDFDPLLVSKLNEKKIIAPGSTATSLLSEPKLRAIIENARQMLKIVDEFGSFDRYCWSFVNCKPILSRFRYPRQVPVKTPKADSISKDLMRRGFRSVGPTIIYSFMQASGITNDHLISCYRFEECATGIPSSCLDENNTVNADNNITVNADNRVEEIITADDEKSGIDTVFSNAVSTLNIS